VLGNIYIIILGLAVCCLLFTDCKLVEPVEITYECREAYNLDTKESVKYCLIYKDGVLVGDTIYVR
jgi:hypothetical protein